MSRAAGLVPVLEALVLTLWVGALWTVGYIVAPALFAHFGDPAVAGAMAGRLFTLVTWISLASAAVLLALYAWRREGLRLRAWLALSAAGLLAASQFAVRPLMESARLPDGSAGPGFGAWHGVSQGLYLAASLVALALVVASTRRRAQAGRKIPGDSGSGR